MSDDITPDVVDTVFDRLSAALTTVSETCGWDDETTWAFTAKLTDALQVLGSEHMLTPKGCDGCDRSYDPDLLEEADLAPFAVAYDTDGTVDVQVCGACVAEGRRETYESEKHLPWQ